VPEHKIFDEQLKTYEAADILEDHYGKLHFPGGKIYDSEPLYNINLHWLAGKPMQCIIDISSCPVIFKTIFGPNNVVCGMCKSVIETLQHCMHHTALFVIKYVPKLGPFYGIYVPDYETFDVKTDFHNRISKSKDVSISVERYFHLKRTVQRALKVFTTGKNKM